MNTASAVASRLVELCQERNITVNYLSTLSAVRQSTVNDIVSGKTQNPGIVTIKKLCDGLEISIAVFLILRFFATLSRKSSKYSPKATSERRRIVRGSFFIAST